MPCATSRCGFAHELADRIRHDIRLVGDLIDGDTVGQRVLEALVGRFNILADIGDLEALGHGKVVEALRLRDAAGARDCVNRILDLAKRDLTAAGRTK